MFSDNVYCHSTRLSIQVFPPCRWFAYRIFIQQHLPSNTKRPEAQRAGRWLLWGRDGTKMNQTDTCQLRSSYRSLCFLFLLHFIPLFKKHTSLHVHTCILHSVTIVSTELVRVDSGRKARGWPELQKQWAHRGRHTPHAFIQRPSQSRRWSKEHKEERKQVFHSLSSFPSPRKSRNSITHRLHV